MAKASKAWQQIMRICNATGADPVDVYERGKAFLEYYREICSMPEYALAPEPYGSMLDNWRIFLDEMDMICAADSENIRGRLQIYQPSGMPLQGLVSTIMAELNQINNYGTIYCEIIDHKYQGPFQMTDAEISELMSISATTYYARSKEACAYFMLTMTYKVLPRMRREFLRTEKNKGDFPEAACE